MSLTQADEHDLFARYHATQDVALLNKIVEQYAYITDILARRFVGKGLEFDDIYQAQLIKEFEEALGI